MEGMKYLYELFEALPRCGPGDSQSTRRAFQKIPHLEKPPLILDIGCGTGDQTLELAKLSKGKIIALDNHQPFLDILMKKAKKEGLAELIVPKNVSMLDMDFKENTFDLIWSEGALYFMGFQNGLRRCHHLLKMNGFLAVTELVYTSPHPPTPVVQFFENEYPDIDSIQGKMELIQNEGFRMLSHFTLPKSSWWDPYYLPMEKELRRLRKKYHDNETALSAYEEIEKEIDFYRNYSDFYGYEFFIMQSLP